MSIEREKRGHYIKEYVKHPNGTLFHILYPHLLRPLLGPVTCVNEEEAGVGVGIFIAD